MSLRNRILLPLVAVLVLSAAVLGAFVLSRARADLVGQVDRRLPGQLASHRPELDRPPPERQPDEVPDREFAYLRVDGQGARVLAAPAGDGRVFYALPTAATAIEASRRPRRPFTLTVAGIRYRALGAVTDDGGAQIELATLGAVDGAVDRLRTTLVVGTVASLLALVALVWLVLQRSLRPVVHITEVAGDVAGGNRRRRVEDMGRARELTDLGANFNHMVDQLQRALGDAEASESQMRQFVADASHELQTPITAVRAYAEMHRSGALDDDEALAAAMRSIGSASRRMGVLVDDLALLAAIDRGVPFASGTVDLGVLVADAVADAVAIDPERSYTAADAVARVLVPGDEDRLRQAFDNLLRNARVHTPTGTHVATQVVVDGARAMVRIVDDGPGVSEELLGRLCNRFEGSGRGSGLGLAITKAIVEHHGGGVTVVNGAAGGFEVTIDLPSAATPSGPQPPG